MSSIEHQYLEHLKRLTEAPYKGDRTGTGTRSIFGHQMRHDFIDGFPLLTTKKVHLKSIIHELLWFISGNTNIKYLKDNGVKIWDAWASEEGDLGPVYGSQWRSWISHDGRVIDQLAQAINTLRTDPDSRRNIVSAWNPGELDQMALPPCHMMFQFYSRLMSLQARYRYAAMVLEQAPIMDATHEDLDQLGVPRRGLSLQMYQRSADWFLGVPFNIASYALLNQMVAHLVDMAPQDVIFTYGDTHLYENHIEQATEQLNRSMRALPRMQVTPKGATVFSIDGFEYDDFELTGYDPHPAIKAPVAV